MRIKIYISKKLDGKREVFDVNITNNDIKIANLECINYEHAYMLANMMNKCGNIIFINPRTVYDDNEPATPFPDDSKND